MTELSDSRQADTNRIRNLMSVALSDRLQYVLGQSDIEHSAYSLEYIADEVLGAALCAARREGHTLQKTTL
jgi:hypothetical protein